MKNDGLPIVKFVLALFSLLCAPVGFAQDADLLQDADTLLYSGEVVWSMEFEAFQPAPPIPETHKPVGLSGEEFSAWIKKLAGYRKQTFTMRAVFKGDNLRFECQSAPGDVYPTKCDQIVTCNQISVAWINTMLATLFRQPLTDSFLKHQFSTFFISPRICGYNSSHILALAREVVDAHERKASEFHEEVDTAHGNAIILTGVYTDGAQKIAELVPDAQFGQILKSIKYICPAFKTRISIVCSEMKTYSDGTVFPGKTVVSHYVGGQLDNLDKAIQVDRLTLTVLDAKFNGPYDDELFNPGCPQGYTDLQDIRWMRKKALTKK